MIWLPFGEWVRRSNTKQAELGSFHSNPGERCGQDKVVAKPVNLSEKYFSTQNDRTL